MHRRQVAKLQKKKRLYSGEDFGVSCLSALVSI